MHPWHDIPLPDDLTQGFPAFVEIPAQSKVKFELDKATGIIKVDRVLYGAVHYPMDYGFIPRTLCGDGDPLDFLVLGQSCAAPGVLMTVRSIGVMRMHDKGEDDKLICVLISDPSVAHLKEISELPAHTRNQLIQFFRDYKKLEGKSVEVEDEFGDAAKSLEILEDAIQLYKTQRDDLLRQVLKPHWAQ